MQLTDQIHMLPLVIYLDEAGRWPLAGPVWVWSIIKCQTTHISGGFQDSKQLNAQQREAMMQSLIQLQNEKTIVYWYGSASNKEIDNYGIISAIQMASVRSIAYLLQHYYLYVLHDQLITSVWWEDHLFVITIDHLIAQWLQSDWDFLHFIKIFTSQWQKQFQRKGLIRDGNHRFGLDTILWCPVQTIIGWDAKNVYISMASIVAKVSRDVFMTEIDHRYHQWWFATHKWYGTATHRALIDKYQEKKQNLTPLHRLTYIHSAYNHLSHQVPKHHRKFYRQSTHPHTAIHVEKPKLLLHICCAPDLSRPLRRLKDHFKLYLFWYNPNIHPKPQHDLRYEQFVKLYNLEWWDYEIVQDWYEPKEFFDSFVTYRSLIKPELVNADRNTILKEAGAMEEWSDRCNPCYLMRLEQWARQAQKLWIPYFSSTLLISPKKVASKLFQFGLQAQEQTTGTKFLRFDFAKHDGYHKASQITKEYDLYRQNYCGCGRTIPKPWDQRVWYKWG